MPNVLIVEDDEERIKWFRREIPPSWNVLDTKDPVQAVKWLMSHEFDYIFLDHDLDFEAYEDQECKNDSSTTGYAVALWLEAHNDKQPGAEIFIHTCNTVGGDRMFQALKGRKVNRIAFPELKKKLKFNEDQENLTKLVNSYTILMFN